MPAPHVSGDPYLPLKRLTRYRFHVVGSLVRESSHFLTHLFLQCSGLAQANPLGRPLGATGCALIEDFPSAEALAALPVEDLVTFLIQQGKNRFPDPAGMAQRVQQAARESYRLRPELARSEHFILANLIRTIRALKASLKEINKAIADELVAFPNTLTTLPGVGPVLAAGILAEVGDIQRFASDDQLAKLAGLCGSGINRAHSKPKSGEWWHRPTSTCATIWSKPPTHCGCTMRRTGPSMRPNTRRSRNTNINAPWCSPPASWCGWSTRCSRGARSTAQRLSSQPAGSTVSVI
ncbi:MAG: IS110 family transposase [candidate division NC10 bacterium]|nr:IS110 family transposase [candidate division NC10 bacterium]